MENKRMITREYFPNFNQYFESVLEWQEFSQEITDTFIRLEKEGKENIKFYINSYSVYEYGEHYAELEMKFYYDEEMSEEEIAKDLEEKARQEKMAKLDEILSEFKVTDSTIYAIKSDQLLTDRVLSGELVFEKKEN